MSKSACPHALPLCLPLQEGKGLAVFSFRGTDSSKGSSLKGQMRCGELRAWLLGCPAQDLPGQMCG